MYYPKTAWIFFTIFSLGFANLAHGLVTRSQLENEYGPIQGRMELGVHTVLIFDSVRVKFHRETGVMNLIPVQDPEISSIVKNPAAPISFLELKRKIARLPAHEQVRYWKLQQIRFPENDVSSELEAALDKMETVRKQSLEKEVKEVEITQESGYRYRRSRSSYIPYFPSFGHSSSYRSHRAFRKDTQIELDRIQRQRRPVESFNTPMSIADRARSQALSKVSGARSAVLGSTR